MKTKGIRRHDSHLGRNRRPSNSRIREDRIPPELHGEFPLRAVRRGSVGRRECHNHTIRGDTCPLDVEQRLRRIDDRRRSVARGAVRVDNELLDWGLFVFRDNRELVTVFDVWVVSEMLGCSARLVHAIGTSDCPAELKSHDKRKDERDGTMEHIATITRSYRATLAPSGQRLYSRAVCAPAKHATPHAVPVAGS